MPLYFHRSSIHKPWIRSLWKPGCQQKQMAPLLQPIAPVKLDWVKHVHTLLLWHLPCTFMLNPSRKSALLSYLAHGWGTHLPGKVQPSLLPLLIRNSLALLQNWNLSCKLLKTNQEKPFYRRSQSYLQLIWRDLNSTRIYIQLTQTLHFFPFSQHTVKHSFLNHTSSRSHSHHYTVQTICRKTTMSFWKRVTKFWMAINWISQKNK